MGSPSYKLVKTIYWESTSWIYWELPLLYYCSFLLVLVGWWICLFYVYTVPFHPFSSFFWNLGSLQGLGRIRQTTCPRRGSRHQSPADSLWALSLQTVCPVFGQEKCHQDVDQRRPRWQESWMSRGANCYCHRKDPQHDFTHAWVPQGLPVPFEAHEFGLRPTQDVGQIGVQEPGFVHEDPGGTKDSPCLPNRGSEKSSWSLHVSHQGPIRFKTHHWRTSTRNLLPFFLRYWPSWIANPYHLIISPWYSYHHLYPDYMRDYTYLHIIWMLSFFFQIWNLRRKRSLGEAPWWSTIFSEPTPVWMKTT